MPLNCLAQQDELEPEPEQAQTLDLSMLIDALAQEGMDELLLHLIKTEKPDDVVVVRQTQIAGLRIQYQRLLTESSQAAQRDPQQAEALRTQAKQAYQLMADAMRGLIKDYHDHDQRPIWQTDLAQSLILDDLFGLNQSAPLFADFGITTPEQRKALNDVAPEALALLADAQLRLFNLRGEVGRDPARSQQLQSDGLFFRLFDEYDQKRTPYFLAYAAYLVARLPDDAPYYAQPESTGTAPALPREQEPDRERARLLQLAEGELKKVIGKLTDGLGVRDAATTLQASVLLARGRFEPAMQTVDELVQSSERGFHWFTARLIRASALDGMGRYDQAMIELNELRHEPTVTDDLRYSLLVTDLTHRVMFAEANRQPPNRRDQAIAQSYQPYLELLTGPINGQQAQGLRDFIYRRWEASLGQDAQALQKLPAMVRLAISQVLRQQAQAIVQQLNQADAAPTDPPVDRTALREHARRKFDASIQLAQALIGPEIDPAIRSEAMFNLALAMYGLAPDDAGKRLKLTAILTDLADQMPGEPVAEDAITAAVSLLRELHQVLPAPPGVEAAYQRAVGVLFSKFPTSEAADSERLYYGYAVLAQSGRHREAVDMFQRVPFDHDDYFRAQRQALISLLTLEREADSGTRPRLRRELDSAMQRINTEAGRIRDSLINPDRAELARRAEATVRLTRAELAMDDGDFDAVVEALDGFEASCPQQADLIAQALQMRIIALGDAGRHEALAEAAKRMVSDYPDQAAPVIDQVLTQAEQRIEALQVQDATADSLTHKTLLAQIDAQAHTAEVLSGFLLDWAKVQDFDADTLMPFEVIRAKTLRLARKPDQAYPILSRLIVDYPNDAQVMLEYAQVLFEKGDEDSLVEAVRYFDRLITGLGEPYPKEWWIAWMRRLQINDRMNEGADEILLRVRQLRMTDPELGGPVTKLALEHLERKYGH